MKEFLEILSKILKDNPKSITLSNTKHAETKYKKTKIRQISADTYQFESFSDKQAFHENVPIEALTDKIIEYFNNYYRQLDAQCETKNYSLKLSKKGKLLFSSSKKCGSDASETNSVVSHNREKNYILKNGEYVPALFELGVMTADGKVKNQSYDKFKQINRFAELIDDIVRHDGREEYNIIDFGCGKSYLTFILYHYMTKIAGKKVNIVGLDLKKDVIEKCNSVAKKYGYENLHFFCGDIKDYNTSFTPDMVITLHACDTATDYALYNACRWGADYILSVPCCQHEINLSTKQDKNNLFNSYGIIKERYCALATDAIRGKLLEGYGYDVNILEFIDIVHSPKNLLIRAKRTGKKNRNSYLTAKDFCENNNISQTLLKLFETDGETI